MKDGCGSTEEYEMTFYMDIEVTVPIRIKVTAENGEHDFEIMTKPLSILTRDLKDIVEEQCGVDIDEAIAEKLGINQGWE